MQHSRNVCRVYKFLIFVTLFNKKIYFNCDTHSQALQPMQGLARLKRSPPTISTLGTALPVPDSQPLCIPHHSIHTSKVWLSHSPSALRLVHGDFLAW